MRRFGRGARDGVDGVLCGDAAALLERYIASLQALLTQSAMVWLNPTLRAETLAQIARFVHVRGRLPDVGHPAMPAPSPDVWELSAPDEACFRAITRRHDAWLAAQPQPIGQPARDALDATIRALDAVLSQRGLVDRQGRLRATELTHLCRFVAQRVAWPTPAHEPNFADFFDTLSAEELSCIAGMRGVRAS